RFAWGKGYSYYIHGAWWHNNFGKPQSHGCVNVAYEHMERLYTWAQVGTKVIISS
ncbi:MAG: L,D-transpeptidase, partial [Candidatus Veblenbacteria bacterium]|nr:L,D-transpeptidase [Candidatus Veblenbacteria bacterium]